MPKAPDLHVSVKSSLAAKLLLVQKEVGAIKKDSDNPYFKSKYADINSFIEVVKPILSKHGIVLLQPLTALQTVLNQEGHGWVPALKTILIDAESGERIEEATVLPTNNDPQKMGSIITYFRRYALQSMLFLQAEDDDANVASGKVVRSNRGPVYEDRDPLLDED